MARGTRPDLRRASAIAFVGICLSAGCGAATGQGTRTSTAVEAASTIRSAESGIAGQTIVIVCGGPASEQGCPRRSVVATIDVLRMPSAQRIATVRTDNRGHFRRNLPPGTYRLHARTSALLIWARAVTVRVPPHRLTYTTITFAPRHPLPVAPGSAVRNSG